MSESKATLSGLRVASFESRRAEEMARLIERFGGQPFVSPSLRETPVAENRPAIEFAHRLLSGQVDIVLFLTGTGARHLLAQIEKHVRRERFFAALSDAVTIVRGPKPLAVLREWGVEPNIRVPAPNTWREILQTIDESVAVKNESLVILEYGLPNASLIAGLEARGAVVESLKVYSWDLPENQEPLRDNVRRLAAGELDVVLFTSAHQVVNVLRTAAAMDLAADLRAQMHKLVVASIGPTTSETLREFELPVDVEPEHGKMGHLVQAAAEQGTAILCGKRSANATVRPAAFSPVSATRAASEGARPAWEDSPFLKACRREPCERVPIWLMRQAGRYMAEYRAVREKTTFLELCNNPRLSAEVMLVAVEKLGVDAAIIFADLLPILQPMGADLEFAQGEGPVIHNPIRTAEDFSRIRELEDLSAVANVFETVRLTRAGLPEAIPVIGFAGAPFTLASYLIEGGGSRNYLLTKQLMYTQPAAWHDLLGKLARTAARYLTAQISAGAQAVQLFDSWAGCLSPADYRTYVLPHVRSIFAALPAGVPAINFATGNPALLPLLAEAGGTVIGLDWRVELADGWRAVGYERSVQGNLDPGVLLADRETIRREALRILQQAGARPGHIFNLGHGIHQQTPVENVRYLVEVVQEYRKPLS